MRSLKVMITVTLPIVLLLAVAVPASESGYKTPPKPVADLINAPWTPSVSIGPNNEWMLLSDYAGYPSIEEVSQPELRLAGLRINPRTNGPSRDWYGTGLTLKKISDGSEYPIVGLPESAHITNIRWSPNGKFVAFTQTDDVLSLWIVDVAAKSAIRLTSLALNDAQGSPYYWLSDNKSIIAKAIVEGRGAAPEKPTVPDGPVIQET